MADMIFPGTAAPADVLTGKKFSAGTNYDTDGSMANQGSPTFTPSGSAQGLPAGYYSGGTISAVVVKKSTGRATASSTPGTFTGSSATLYPVTIPVPSGITKLLGISGQDITNAGGQTYASPDGWAGGQAPIILQAIAPGNTNVASFILLQAGGDLSLTTSSIVLALTQALGQISYCVYYI